jgi:hypothetical protein
MRVHQFFRTLPRSYSIFFSQKPANVMSHRSVRNPRVPFLMYVAPSDAARTRSIVAGGSAILTVQIFV